MKKAKVKVMGMKKAKDLQSMFGDLFSVSEANIHIYLDKCLKLYDHIKKLVSVC